MKEVLPVAARALGLTIQSWEVRDADGFERVFAALSKQRPDGLYVPGGARSMLLTEKRIAELCVKEPVTVDVRQQRICRCRWAHVATGRTSRTATGASHTYVDRILKGSQACRSAGGAADEVRAGDQSQNGEADRADDSAESMLCAGG